MFRISIYLSNIYLTCRAATSFKIRRKNDHFTKKYYGLPQGEGIPLSLCLQLKGSKLMLKLKSEQAQNYFFTK